MMEEKLCGYDCFWRELGHMEEKKQRYSASRYTHIMAGETEMKKKNWILLNIIQDWNELRRNA
jgi:hypothetical protein